MEYGRPVANVNVDDKDVFGTAGSLEYTGLCEVPGS